ncbi:hypothetical protein GJ700_18105 [Duganella sp. FT92W]|uniref:Phage tail sheath family protein n=1 Tax=Pseudoduganella rivuli TaxID=2666085 RepID=A0A7X2IQD0_9BURK|nr:phage tail sheath family protein [Pseudoduganella rivuli]MRV73628.1 hypothetical protein [Pseudoduganella rivuli]
MRPSFTSAHPPHGMPGIYAQAQPRLHPQPMDVCAFIGVAPRGPAYQPEPARPGERGSVLMSDPARPCRRSVPVLVHSFDEYRALFGGFEGPGYLPHAVAMFFEQGGRSAYIVRIVHEYDPPAPWHEAWARGGLASLASRPLTFLARNEGSWGNGLQVEGGLTAAPLAFAWRDGAVCVDRAGASPAGTLLRLEAADGAQVLAYCRGVSELRAAGFALPAWALALDPPLPPQFAPVRIDVVQAWLAIREEGEGGHAGQERHEMLGLTPRHPRWIGSVLCDESRLLWPDPSWAGQELWPARAAVETVHGVSAPFSGGRDRYADVQHEDFFDAGAPWSGLAALGACPEVTHVVVPDLYVPAQWAGDDAGIEGGAGAAPSALRKLILDPRDFADLTAIAALQQKVLDACESGRAMIALLDVPPGLSQAQASRWRAQFCSSWGAAYHPWLVPSRQLQGAQPTGQVRPLPPSAVAAGIIARDDIAEGVRAGPAVARAVVRLAEPQPAGRADAFQPLGLNCFVRGPDGVELVSARTLSRDRAWRQLSARRLMLMLERTLQRETRWAVAESGEPSLWQGAQQAVDNLLLRLFRAGACAGATPAESYFVRVKREPAGPERGELRMEIGVAPAEPREFVVLCLHRHDDGALVLER